jgi:FixJ family two-component response regulator
MSATLTTRQQQVLDRLMLAQTDTQIARELGISLTRVGQLKKSALLCLYREYRRTHRTTTEVGVAGNPERGTPTPQPATAL